MNDTFLIAGLRIRCEIPFELNISPNTLPFLCDESSAKPDFIFRFHPVEELLLPPEPGVFLEEVWLNYDSDGFRIFQCYLDMHEPYAKVYWNRKEPSVLHCDYKIGCEKRIDQSHNIVNLLHLETFLLLHDALLLHASFISCNDRGILFTAPSGTGKSTQAELWRKYEAADILNGDRAALRKTAGIWHGWGLPYAGTSGIYRNESAPIAALVVLRQAKENRIRRLNPAEALRYVYPELSIHRWNAGSVEKAVNLFLEMTESVPVYYLECLPDEGAVQLLKNTLAEVDKL